MLSHNGVNARSVAKLNVNNDFMHLISRKILYIVINLTLWIKHLYGQKHILSGLVTGVFDHTQVSTHQAKSSKNCMMEMRVLG